jgi:hypothetical protein
MSACAKEFSEILKNWAEIVAYGLAAIFFIYRAFSGYLVTNLSVRISCSREIDPADNTAELVSISLVLLKGERGSVWIHDIEIRNNGHPITEKATALREQLWRFSYKSADQEPGSPKKILWDKRSKSSPFVALAPGEETQLASYFKVGRRDVCHIEAVLSGRRPYSRSICQWRASTISFPIGN